MKKIFIVLGTRPEVIKLAPVYFELKKYEKEFDVILCSTGQHNEMLKQMLEVFEIDPDINLNVMVPDQTLAYLSSEILVKVDIELKEIRPDLVMVQGDTTTAFVTSLAAFYNKIPVAHVEAGLRTSDIYNPFPEEINRRLIAPIAQYNFIPTLKAYRNLVEEGIPRSKLYITGNTVIDAIKWILSRKKMNFEFGFETDGKKLVLMTAHRRENFDRGLHELLQAVSEIVNERDDVMFIYPVHLNPNVRKTVYHVFKDGSVEGKVLLTDPLRYDEFIHLMHIVDFIVTDSGGIQEEAPFLGKPVIVVRKTTERSEAIEEGVAKLAGTDKKSIKKAIQSLLDDERIFENVYRKRFIFGDGKAAQRIVSILMGKEFAPFLPNGD